MKTLFDNIPEIEDSYSKLSSYELISESPEYVQEIDFDALCKEFSEFELKAKLWIDNPEKYETKSKKNQKIPPICK